MEAGAVRCLFETILPYEFIKDSAARLGVVQREREFDPVRFLHSMVLVGGTPEAGRIAAVIRDYYQRGSTKVARSAYYRWFDDELLELMIALKTRALDYVAQMPKHLPGILANRVDWRAIDSTTVRLPDTLEAKAEFPGCGDYAALKVHTEISLGNENLVDWHITPARDHDAPELVISESRRGTGLIVDLGYVSHDLLRKCHQYDVHIVIRLKEGWNLFLDDDVMAASFCAWTIPDEMLDFFDGRPLPEKLDCQLDVDVRMGPANSPVRARLINVKTPEGWRAFVTTLPRTTHDAEAVALIYRLRWSVELQHKLAKSGCQLDEVTSGKPASAKILVHAAMLASLLANALVHLEHVEQGLVGAKVKKMKSPPLHPMNLWKCMVVAAYCITELLAKPGVTDADWVHTASVLRYGAQDPNWRRSPSPMDDVKGRNAEGRAFRRLPDNRPRRRRSVGGAK